MVSVERGLELGGRDVAEVAGAFPFDAPRNMAPPSLPRSEASKRPRTVRPPHMGLVPTAGLAGEVVACGRYRPRVVAFLASAAAGNITGTDVRIDGALVTTI